MKNIMHIGLDVDDKAFHGAGFCEKSGETVEFSCRPTAASLLKKLGALKKQGFKLKTCYEASYIGFSLHRALKKKGIDNSVIAPSLIPKTPGRAVKTDRLDSRRMAEFFAKGLLTEIFVPEEEDERVRDLIRSRGFLVRKSTALKRHILSLCRRHGLDYRGETGSRSHWTAKHKSWLKAKAKDLGGDGRLNICLLMNQRESLSQGISSYNEEIERFSRREKYKGACDILCCFRGLDRLSAMTLAVETADIRRFPHPRQFSAYAGFDVREHSSGGKERKFGITKLGNKAIRTVAVEACQQLGFPPAASRRLKEARAGMPKEIVAIAEKCSRRLWRRYLHLVQRGKPANKAKAACAREMLGFIWAALRAAG